MSEFYNKYRHLFEENQGDFAYFRKGFENSYQPQKAQLQPMAFPTFQPQPQPQQQAQYQPQQRAEFRSQPQKQPIFNQPASYSPFKAQQDSPYQLAVEQRNTVSNRKGRNEEDKIRKQVVQENIFSGQQPAQETQSNLQKTPTKRKLANDESLPPPPNRVNQKFQQQTYNVFTQEKDILDSVVAQRQVKLKSETSPLADVSNLHRVYMQRLNDIDFMKKRFVDPKQLQSQIDKTNPYKRALGNRVMAFLRVGERRRQLKELLSS